MQQNSFVEVLRALQRAFTAINVRWYVFGAQAALFYGSARLTFDVDATVLLGDRSINDLVVALKAQGIAPRIADQQTKIVLCESEMIESCLAAALR